MEGFIENEVILQNGELNTQEKLRILADAAKYDVACTSSGVDRKGEKGKLGNSVAAGICHSFAADGRCISLLKVLMSNHCVYDCKYCQNRKSNDVERATFEPDELCRLTIEFYKRNYIEGLFLSSGVINNPTYTMEKICETLFLLRKKYNFNGYIHVKCIPGAPDDLIQYAGFLADRISINLELPTKEGLETLAPNKTFKTILDPMGKISDGIAAHRLAIGKDDRMERARINDYLPNSIFSKENLLAEQKKQSLNDTSVIKKDNITHSDIFVPKKNFNTLMLRNDTKLKRPFAPAGQSTQMIIGATNESDLVLLESTQRLYQFYDLKRVFYSAYIPINEDSALPDKSTAVPLLREHRLYQADWLLRYYGFVANEILSEDKPNLNEQIDPKCDWAVRHLNDFPVEITRAPYDVLLRVPGIGPKSAMRIVNARRYGGITFESLKKMGVVLKRAHYFILINGKMMYRTKLEQDYILRGLTADNKQENWQITHQNDSYHQLSFMDMGVAQ